VAFDASQLTDNDAEELKQQGLILLERNEDGYTVFVTAANEEIAGEGATDSKDEEEDEDEDEGQDDEDVSEEVDEDESEDESEDHSDESEGTDYKGRFIPNQDSKSHA
jgi:hypothetical protein